MTIQKSRIPEISVIMPVFNGARFIKRAIDSVLSQKFQDWELVAVDDASNDDSYRLLSKYALSDARIISMRLAENSGASAARNFALQYSKGQTIAYLDCDDEYYPEYLEYVHKLRGKGDVLVFAYDAIDDDGVFLRPGERRTWTPAAIRMLLFQRNVTCPLGIAHRRDLLGKAGFFNESKRVLEDWDLWKRFALTGAEFVFFSIRSGLYHIRADSQSRVGRIPATLPPRIQWRNRKDDK